jgi:hypothetical protein
MSRASLRSAVVTAPALAVAGDRTDVSYPDADPVPDPIPGPEADFVGDEEDGAAAGTGLFPSARPVDALAGDENKLWDRVDRFSSIVGGIVVETEAVVDTNVEAVGNGNGFSSAAGMDW